MINYLKEIYNPLAMKVSVVKCDDYNYDDVYKAVKKSVDLIGGIEKFVAKGASVLIKPNILMAKLPERAVTTHPTVVKAVIELVKKQTDKIFVGDSPGYFDIYKVAKPTGIADVCKETNAKLVSFKEQVDIQFKEGKLIKHFEVGKIVKDVDVIINVPKLKTHAQAVFTGAVKNLFGCIYGKKKPQFHLKLPDYYKFNQMLVDLCEFIKPRLNIMDAIVGMEGHGPSNGDPKKIGLLLASGNAYALDNTACKIAGIDEKQVFTNVIAEKIYGNEISVVGEKVNDVKVRDFKTIINRQKIAFGLPRWLSDFIRNTTAAKPVVDREKCKACGNCIAVCPAKTIKMVDKKAHIYHDKCIRCYCCHEFCPYNAIELKKPLMKIPMDIGRSILKRLK